MPYTPNFFLPPFLSLSHFFYRHHRNQRKSEASRFYVLYRRAFHFLSPPYPSPPFPLSMQCFFDMMGHTTERERKNREKLPLRKCLFPVLWFFSMREFFPYSMMRETFFRFHFKFDPTFFSSSMVCE